MDETYAFLLSFPAKRQYTYSNMLKKGTGLIPTKVTRKYYNYSYNILTIVINFNIYIVTLPPPQAFQKNKIDAKRTERPAD
jgi:hypothetical protein